MCHTALPSSQKGPADLTSWHVNRDQFTHQKSAATPGVSFGSCLALQEDREFCVKLNPWKEQGDEWMCLGWKPVPCWGYTPAPVWQSSGGKLETHTHTRTENMLLLPVWKVGCIQHCKWETDSSLTQRIGLFLLCHCNFFECREVHPPTDDFTRGCFCALWLCAHKYSSGMGSWHPLLASTNIISTHHIQFFKT